LVVLARCEEDVHVIEEGVLKVDDGATVGLIRHDVSCVPYHLEAVVQRCTKTCLLSECHKVDIFQLTEGLEGRLLAREADGTLQLPQVLLIIEEFSVCRRQNDLLATFDRNCLGNYALRIRQFVFRQVYVLEALVVLDKDIASAG